MTTGTRRENFESGEDRLIARFFRPLATHPGAFGLGDDAAAICPPAGCDLVVKADAIIGSVHFFIEDAAETVAKKALRVNLSDLAAKGARPLGFLLSLALPKGIDDVWLERFAAGLREDVEAYGCPLFGGDTDRTPGPITISIAAFGAVPHGTMLLRSGARAGDRVVVTGTIGDAALGLAVRGDAQTATRWGLDPAGRDHLLARYLVPEPRNAIADILRRHASGAMDVSDGLAGDLAKMCRASGLFGEIEVARVPLSPAARQALAADPALMERILTGGDDYEVVASVAPDELANLQKQAAVAGVTVTEIGCFKAAGEGEGEARFLLDGKKLVFARPSFSHF